jgi:hypothetical protein
MKNYILTCFLCATALSFAGKTDSTFQRHQISFSVTNAMSQQFFDGPHGPTIRLYNNDWFYTNFLYLPNYTLHLRLNYSLGISKHIRIETGIGYMLQGITMKGAYSGEVDFESYTGYSYTGEFTIPIHAKFAKPIGKGAFTCTVGPDLYLPVIYFIRKTQINGGQEANISSQIFTSSSTLYQSSIGFALKMGYEKRINHKLSVDMGPVVNFSNLLFLSKQINQMYASDRPYQYYIGLDVAFNFEVGKKK